MLLLQVSHPQALRIGERIPDLIFTGVKNDPDAELSMRELRGQWVLLDFWGTGCSSCISAFPKIDSLQQQFNGRLQIITVNKETADSTARFFAKRKRLPQPHVPMIMGDQVLHPLFPHVYVPLHVWIDPSGVIRYITDASNAHAKNITALLAGEQVAMNFIEYVVDRETDKPMIAKQNGKWLDKVEYYSVILHCVPGVSAFNRQLSNALSRNCNSMRQLFETAFSEQGKIDLRPFNTIRVLTADSSRFAHPADKADYNNWYNSSCYTYQLKIPEERSAQLYAIMQQDLQRFFGVTARIERQLLPCLVLTAAPLSRFQTKAGSDAAKNVVLSNGDSTWLSNFGFTDFFNEIQERFSMYVPPIPLVNGISSKGRIDLVLPNGPEKWETVINALKSYGFQFRVERRWKDVLVIRQQSNR